MVSRAFRVGENPGDAGADLDSERIVERRIVKSVLDNEALCIVWAF